MYPPSMPEAVASIEAGRRAYTAADWRTAFAEFSRARESVQLDVDDLAHLSRSAWLLSLVQECLQLSEEAFRGYLDEERVDDAAMCALVLSLQWLTRGEIAVGSGWLNRARRLLAELPDRPAHGYLAYMDGMLALEEAGPPPIDAIARLEGLARRFGDPALESLWLALSGVSELRHGDKTRGFAQLDEAMLPVLAGRVPVEWAGDIYCTVIHCATNWPTSVAWRTGPAPLSAGARNSPAMPSTPGSAASIDWSCGASMATGPAWRRVSPPRVRHCATETAGLPARASTSSGRSAGCAETMRVRGRHSMPSGQAASIRSPVRHCSPSVRGGLHEAWTGLAAAFEGRDRVGRVRLLRAGVEIALANGRMTDAEAFCRELRGAATDYASRGFAAWADHADGMLAVAQGRGDRAGTALRSAISAFRQDRQPYETAQALLWMSRARLLTNEPELAERALAESRTILQRLGATTEVDAPGPHGVGPLTAREAEVLECIAAGAGNREAAARLFISEKTVGRHLANVYLKLGVNSRTAAAAWWRDRQAPTHT